MPEYTVKDVAFYVNEIRDTGHTPSEWEEKFLESMDKLVENNWKVSEKQMSCLLKIYEKATA